MTDLDRETFQPMLVVHANWTAGALRLWAESLEAWQQHADHATGDSVHANAEGGVLTASATTVQPHPFAADAATLRAAIGGEAMLDASTSFQVQLPATSNGDGVVALASEAIAGLVGDTRDDAEVGLAAFEVPGVTVGAADAIAFLLRYEGTTTPGEIELGHGLRYWIEVARFVLELLVDQRFIPSLVQRRADDLHAAWQPWLHDEEARRRVGRLIKRMPPVVRAVVDDNEGRPWPILEEALRTLTDATVRAALIADDFGDAVADRDPGEDPHVAWLAGLLDRATGIEVGPEPAAEMLRDVGRWIGQLDDVGQDRLLRLGFELSEPQDDPDARDATWQLDLFLTAADGAARVGAEQVWREPGAVRAAVGVFARHPEELLLAELGRAARIYPKLESALSEAEPADVTLTTAEAAAFLKEYRELLEESGFEVITPGWWGRPSAQLGVRLQLDAPPLEADMAVGTGLATAGDSLLGLNSLVRFEWQLAVGEQPLTMEEFHAIVREKSSLVRLRGQWVAIEPDQLERARTLLEERPAGEMTLLEAVHLAHGAGEEPLGLPVLGLDATGWVADLLMATEEESVMPRLPQPDGFQGTLRPYQSVGLSWLAFLDRFGLGACLADDMGLGKTIQLIALLLSEREHRSNGHRLGPTLLVVPTSVVSNWQRELARFAPTLTVHIQHGPDRPSGDGFTTIAEESDVVITTYTLVSRDRGTLSRVTWHRVVLDEAQYIKNPPTKQTATIRALDTTRRIALTGTPVENRLSELWSIMEFCNPGYLGPPAEFRRRFSIPVERHRDQDRAEQLRRLVRPFVLRRLKTDPTVIDDLPPCVTTREYATLTPEQAGLYQQAVSRMLGQVNHAEGIQRRGLVLATLVKLKQICDHPALLEMSNDAGSHRAVIASGGAARLAARSGKCARLMQMLEEVVAAGDKALLFTQFRRMGHLLAAMIQHDLDTEVMFLHGGTPPPKRQQMLDRFQDPKGGVPIFVLSLKAGGIGVNLTAANHVFHFDRWWNPAVENQATDRAFRIGQTRTVHVHKFVCLGTLEERIDQMIEQKSELARNIIGSGEQWLTELSTGQLQELLRLRDGAMEADA
ncbi:MAG: DEAD/DEAH box helicase [Phycisphaerales bacterium]|nr:DEAD/DEAH box helicase [Phycisphaerales bacterium]